MKLTREVLAEEYGNYEEAPALSLEGKGLTQLRDIGLCAGVEYLSLRFNSLVSLREVGNCKHLWILDAQQNRLRDIEGLSAFAALGTVTLSGNDLQLSALRPLEAVVILHLEASLAKGSRKEVIRTLPGTCQAGTVDL